MGRQLGPSRPIENVPLDPNVPGRSTVVETSKFLTPPDRRLLWCDDVPGALESDTLAYLDDVSREPRPESNIWARDVLLGGTASSRLLSPGNTGKLPSCVRRSGTFVSLLDKHREQVCGVCLSFSLPLSRVVSGREAGSVIGGTGRGGFLGFP